MGTYDPTDDDRLDAQVVYVTVKLVVKPNVDVVTMIENIDYEFRDDEDSIISSEIIDVLQAEE